MNNAAFKTYKTEFRAVIRQVLIDRIQITSIAWLYWPVALFEIFTVQA